MRIITFGKTLDTPTVAEAGLGDRAMTPDGRQWVYVKANEAVSTIGMALTRIANTDVDTVSSSTDTPGDEIFVTEGSAGWTIGIYQDAYGLVDDGTGEGQFFKIQNNTADTLRLFKDYALTTSLDVADSDIVLVRPHLAEKTAITVLHQIPVGGAQVAFTSKDYGWALERGPGSVLAGAALIANELCTPGDNTEGTVITIASGETADDASTFGRCLVANTNVDKAAMIDYNLL